MIHALRRTNDEDKPRNMREWTKVGLNDPARMESRRKKYTERALKARQDRLAKALRGESGSGIPREAIVGLGRPSGDQLAQTRRDTGARGGHRPPPINVPSRSHQNAPVQRPRDGSWAAGGQVMAFSEEQRTQITDKIAELLRKKHGSKATDMASDEFKKLRRMTDPRELQQALAQWGIIVQNPTTLGLAAQYHPQDLLMRAKELMYPHEKGGLEMPRQIADLMMESMLSQRSISAADRLFESWMALRRFDTPRRAAEKRRLADRFGDSIYLAENDLPRNIYGPERLVQPWDIPGWDDSD